MLESMAFYTSQFVFPLAAIFISIIALYVYVKSQRVRINDGDAEPSGFHRELFEIRKRIDNDIEAAGSSPSERQFALIKEYHAQGLAQSKVSFWFSLIFAALGFLMILYSIVFYLGITPETENAEISVTSSLSNAQKPIFALVAGTVVEAVAALFFVQSNKARQLMSDFFDKARMDRKLDESLVLASQVEDKDISARLKAYLAMSFAEVGPDTEILGTLFYDQPRKPNKKQGNQKPD